MKNSKKLFRAAFFLEMIICITANAQTNVSGGIFTSTTWTLANSPYIVVDTVVVFPGVTLTVEPGVTVKFNNNKYLELRQATLIAIGTVTDSITFTSNALSPTPGIWGRTNLGEGGIWLNSSTAASVFNFCNIKYATSGVGGNINLPYIKNSSFTHNQHGIGNVYSTPFDSCIFKFNETGISNLVNSTLNSCIISNNNYGVDESGNAVLNNCILDSNFGAFGGGSAHINGAKLYYCSISHNQYGIGANNGSNLLNHCVINYNTIQGIGFGLGVTGPDSVINCEIKYNGNGVFIHSGNQALITQCDIEYDTIGILVNSPTANIFCNKICNNINFGLQMSTSANFNADNNYWCTTDSAQIAAAIYDGYDNVAFGLVTFMPLDTVCYLTTGIPNYEVQPISFSIFPNPAANYITIALPENISKAEIKIFNLLGELMSNSILVNLQTKIDISKLSSGVYILEVANGENLSRQKFIKQ